jgi:hypothetical protein
MQEAHHLSGERVGLSSVLGRPVELGEPPSTTRVRRTRTCRARSGAARPVPSYEIGGSVGTGRPGSFQEASFGACLHACRFPLLPFCRWRMSRSGIGERRHSERGRAAQERAHALGTAGVCVVDRRLVSRARPCVLTVRWVPFVAPLPFLRVGSGRAVSLRLHSTT